MLIDTLKKGVLPVDRVDDFFDKLCDLDELELQPAQLHLIQKVIGSFSENSIKYLRIHRGLSESDKIIIKPKALFPLLVKIGPKEDIQKEVEGDHLLRNRMPPLSLPPIDCVHYENTFGIIAYRYITGGRVRELISRFDVKFHELPIYSILQIIDEIFDTILKKCHWLDGGYELRPIKLPDLLTPDHLTNDPNWNLMLKEYKIYKSKISKLVAPHGIIHGDLHAKNILITRNKTPVLIDFSMARSNACHYIDFAKFEINLQFQIKDSVAQKLWRVRELVYSDKSLITPVSNTKLLACVHRVRSNLWQGCMRKSLRMSNNDIDYGYRGYLLYYLGRFYSRSSNNMNNKNIALHQFFCLLGKGNAI